MAVTDANLADTLAILGLKATHGGVDLGVLTDLSINPEITTYDFNSTRSGRVELVKQIVTQVKLTITFSTSNILDPDITELFAGGEGGALTFEQTEGALIITRPNAETGGADQVINIPSASIRGTGLPGAPGTEEAKMSFEAVALLAGGETAIGTITNAVPTNP